MMFSGMSLPSIARPHSPKIFERLEKNGVYTRGAT
jgi:hypothetical protein